MDLHIRQARPEDAPRLQAIRRAAFAPVFASFRSLLGDEIYDLAQRRQDEAQEGLLASLLAGEPGWTLYVAQSGDEIVGFVAVQLDPRPHRRDRSQRGRSRARRQGRSGTAMYEFALARMKEAGMKVATVATGGDPSHAPARRAYQKAGFDAVIPSVWMCRKL